MQKMSLSKAGVLVGLAGLLAACTGPDFGRFAPVQTVYDFGPARVQAGPESGNQRWEKIALEIVSPYRFDKPGISYRLLYKNPQALYDYTESRWVAPPTVLLSHRLNEAIGFGSEPKPCVLRLSLDEFTQRIDTPDQSMGVVQGRMVLLDGERGILAERSVGYEKPASGIDAAGAVAALSAASDALVRDTEAWLLQLKQMNRLQACS